VKAKRREDVTRIDRILRVPAEVGARRKPRREDTVHHCSVAQYRQVEMIAVERNELWPQLRDLIAERGGPGSVGARAIISPAPILAHRMRRRSTPTRPDCRRRSSKSAATRSCSTIQYAWRSGCAPPDVRSSSKYGRGCRTPGKSGRGSFRKRARPSSASAHSCRARCSRCDSTPSRPWS
jgi:hypothetical protein